MTSSKVTLVVALAQSHRGAPRMGQVIPQTCPTQGSRWRVLSQSLVKEFPQTGPEVTAGKLSEDSKRAALPLRDAGAGCLE